MTNLEAAIAVVRSLWRYPDEVDPEFYTGQARETLDAIDPRLVDLTPEDTKAILDHMSRCTDPDGPDLSDHAWEVLSR